MFHQDIRALYAALVNHVGHGGLDSMLFEMVLESLTVT